MFFSWDLVIADNCNENLHNRSLLGFTYKLTSGIEYGSIEAQSYLAGEEEFKIVEAEVFQLFS